MDNIREAGRVRELIVREYNQRFDKQFGKKTLQFIVKQIDIVSMSAAMSSGLAGRHYTLVIADVTYNAMVQHGEKINKMLQVLGAPVIGEIIKYG